MIAALHDPENLSVFVLGFGAGCLTWLAFHLHPRLATAAWVAVICFAPVWTGVTVGFYFAPAVLVGLLIVATVPPLGGALNRADLLFAAIILLSLLPVIAGGAAAFTIFPLVTEILLGYLVGRLLTTRTGPDWVIGSLVVALTLAAGFAVVEFLLSWNPFVLIKTHNPLYLAWGPLQTRGDIVRAEGAFGHSIALGSSLAIAVPFALTRRWTIALRLATTMVLLLGTVVTFSRTAMLCAVLGLVLTVLFLQLEVPARLRLAVVASIGVAGLALAPRIAGVFAAGGAQARGSAAYRGDLLSLIPAMRAIGLSSSVKLDPGGTRSVDGFQSIDNALLLFGLRYGWLPLLVAVGGLGFALFLLISGRGNASLVALVAQIPALVTVALITQYGILFTFLIGVTVASCRSIPPPQRESGRDEPEQRRKLSKSARARTLA